METEKEDVSELKDYSISATQTNHSIVEVILYHPLFSYLVWKLFCFLLILLLLFTNLLPYLTTLEQCLQRYELEICVIQLRPCKICVVFLCKVYTESLIISKSLSYPFNDFVYSLNEF